MKKAKKGPNIVRIAAEGGVSVATVSRVLNNSDSVDPGTRKKIQELINKYGYRPNTRKNRVRNVCIMIQDSRLTFSLDVSAVLTGISDVLIRSGCDVTLVFINQALPPDVITNALRERRSDSAIVLQSTDEAAFFQFFKEERIPFILINNSKDKDTSYICTDNAKGISDALDHLISLGHRDFGFMVGNPGNRDFITRKNTFLEYLKGKRGCTGKCHNLKDFSFPEGITESYLGYHIMKQLHDRGLRETAFFAVNDEFAIGMLKACKETGISVPGDLSIVGFDDYEISSFVEPSLTTISQDLNRIGMDAAWGILALMDGRETRVQHIIEPKLVVRASTGIKPIAAENGHYVKLS